MTTHRGLLLNDVTLPVAPAPVGRYARGMVYRDIGFLSGQFPLRNGQLAFIGRVGAELTEAQGVEAAELAALNVLAQIGTLLHGFERLATLLRVDGTVASADDFLAQPAVLDGASNKFLRLLGERGRHARTAYTAPRLPLDAPVELAVTFAVVGQHGRQ